MQRVHNEIKNDKPNPPKRKKIPVPSFLLTDEPLTKKRRAETMRKVLEKKKKELEEKKSPSRKPSTLKAKRIPINKKSPAKKQTSPVKEKSKATESKSKATESKSKKEKTIKPIKNIMPNSDQMKDQDFVRCYPNNYPVEMWGFVIVFLI